MVNIALPPSQEIARCRVPETIGIQARIGQMGTAAWTWMAMWCPRHLATISDQEAHFKALDRKLERILTESEIRIGQQLGVTDLDDPEQMAEPQEVAMANLRADWVEVCREEPTPVWDPEWTEFKVAYGESLWGRYQGLPIDMLAREIIEHMGPVKLWWTAAKRQRQRELQQILDREMSPLGRHLTFDLAARMARRLDSRPAEMGELVNYPSPPY